MENQISLIIAQYKAITKLLVDLTGESIIHKVEDILNKYNLRPEIRELIIYNQGNLNPDNLEEIKNKIKDLQEKYFEDLMEKI